MTKEDREFLNRINDYANEVLGDIDPQKTQVSAQLQKLRPIMQTLAMEMQMPVEDIFIKYMDLATLVNAKKDQKFKEDMQDLGVLEFK